MLMREGHFGCKCKASLNILEMKDSLMAYLDLDTKCQNEVILQNLYKQMMEPIPGLKFSSVERHALPALEDGFGRKYKQKWMESFCKHLEQYDVNKLQRKS